MEFADFVRNFQVSSDKQMAQFDATMADLSKQLLAKKPRPRRPRRRLKVQSFLRDG